jgi:hypothetical protein
LLALLTRYRDNKLCLFIHSSVRLVATHTTAL